MKEKKLVPKRRFRFFTYMWDKRKLEEVAPLQRGFDLIRSNMNNGPYPVVFSNGIGAWNSIYKVKGPGVVTGRSGSIGNVSYIEHHYWPHNTTLWVTKFFENYPLFIYYLYEKMELSKFASGSGVPTLNRNDVHSYSVFIPNPKEQQKIGKFFKVLDERIANQERKIAKVKALKEAYLTEMFPQEGETVPMRRFAGFRGEWTKKVFGDVLKTHSFKNYLAEPNTTGKYKVIQQGDNPIIGYSDKQPFKLYNQVILFGDHTMSLFKPNNFFLVATDGIKILEINNMKNEFLLTLLTRYMPESEGYKRHFTILQNAYCFIPSNKKEQQKIGKFFKNLDSQIATEEAKLKKLKKMKEAYLEEMFV